MQNFSTGCGGPFSEIPVVKNQLIKLNIGYLTYHDGRPSHFFLILTINVSVEPLHISEFTFTSLSLRK